MNSNTVTELSNGKSFLWSAIERFSVQAVQFIFQIILARLLSPSDYGLIAMLAIFIPDSRTFIPMRETQLRALHREISAYW